MEGEVTPPDYHRKAPRYVKRNARTNDEENVAGMGGVGLILRGHCVGVEIQAGRRCGEVKL